YSKAHLENSLGPYLPIRAACDLRPGESLLLFSRGEPRLRLNRIAHKSDSWGLSLLFFPNHRRRRRGIGTAFESLGFECVIQFTRTGGDQFYSNRCPPRRSPAL